MIDVALRMAVHQAAQHVLEVGVRVDGVELAAFDERSEYCPMMGAFVRAGEQAVLSVEGHRAVILPVSGRK